MRLTPKDCLAHAQLLWVAATLAATQNDYLSCRTLSEESLRLGRQLGDSDVVGWALIWLALARWSLGEVTVAIELIESAISVGKAQPDEAIVLGAMDSLSAMLLSIGDLDGVVKIGEEALAISHKSGELWIRGYQLNFLSQASWQRGEPRRAEEQAKEAAACKYALDDRQGLSIVIETLAWMAAERAAYERAATLIGCAESLRETVGGVLQEHFRAQHERSAAVATEQIGPVAYRSAVDHGRAMTLDEITTYAMEQKPAAASKRSMPQAEAAAGSPIALTRREQEIADLVGRGLSNKQIAAKLVVSERTAEYHILNILNKLGFNSRTQIASWATTQQPTPSLKS